MSTATLRGVSNAAFKWRTFRYKLLLGVLFYLSGAATALQEEKLGCNII